MMLSRVSASGSSNRYLPRMLAFLPKEFVDMIDFDRLQFNLSIWVDALTHALR